MLPWNSSLLTAMYSATNWWMNFYSLISREFYIIDFYSELTRRLLAASARLNVWLRWV